MQSASWQLATQTAPKAALILGLEGGASGGTILQVYGLNSSAIVRGNSFYPLVDVRVTGRGTELQCLPLVEKSHKNV